jgi:hypothetical protein
MGVRNAVRVCYLGLAALAQRSHSRRAVAVRESSRMSALSSPDNLSNHSFEFSSNFNGCASILFFEITMVAMCCLEEVRTEEIHCGWNEGM